MKKIFMLSMSVALFTGSAFSQMKFPKIFSYANSRSLFGMHINSLDIQTPQVWKNNTGTRTLTPLREQDLGFSLSAWKLISEKVDLSAKATMMFHNYSAIDRNENVTNYNKVGIEIEPSVNVKVFNDASKFNAFVTTGLGIGTYSGKMGAYLPIGVGLQANIGGSVYFLLQSQYHKSFNDKTMKNSIVHSFGIAQRINTGDISFKRKH